VAPQPLLSKVEPAIARIVSRVDGARGRPVAVELPGADVEERVALRGDDR